MHMNLGQLEDFSSKLHGLCNVLESLEGPTSDEMSTPFLELQQLVEGVGRVSQVVYAVFFFIFIFMCNFLSLNSFKFSFLQVCLSMNCHRSFYFLVS